jgi:hypothetical protein
MVLSNGSARKYLHDYKEGKIAQGLGIGCKLDEHLRFKVGQYNGILGGDNVGKTYFMTWYMLALTTNHKLKWGIWMDENSKGQVLRDLIQMYSGIPFKNLSHEEIDLYNDYLEDYFFFIDNRQQYKPEDLLKEFESIPADGYFIDPFNQLDHDMNYESNIKFIRSLKRWCKINKKTAYLSMHPVTASGRKISEYPKGHEWEGQPMIPNKSMAEGGKIFANMCDDWINVHRLTKLESMQYFTLIDIDKIKDKDTGGTQTMSNSPLMFYYNHGLGFTIDAVNPIIREAQGLKPLEHNSNFDDKLPF